MEAAEATMTRSVLRPGAGGDLVIWLPEHSWRPDGSGIGWKPCGDNGKLEKPWNEMTHLI